MLKPNIYKVLKVWKVIYFAELGNLLKTLIEQISVEFTD